MERFFVTCPGGLETALSDELGSLGAEARTVANGGVLCAGPFELCYRVNLMSRLASRVLWQIAEGPCADEQDLYRTAAAQPWIDWFSPRHTIKVTVSARHSPMRSLEYATLRIKDAICDRFRETAKRRPSVDTLRPDIRVEAFLDQHRVSLYLDTSGEPLFKRGWRQASGDAPLRENLAAGLLRLAGWTPPQPLLDPFCGAGTILIEAAQIARGVPPGLHRSFAFERLRRHDSASWHAIVAQHAQPSRHESGGLWGSDSASNAVASARTNISALKLSGLISIDRRDVLDLEPPTPNGVIVTNPPYGVRTGERDELAQLYPRLGDRLKQRFAGWRVYLLTADARVPKLIGLAPSRRIPVFNGPLECRLYEFKLVAGSFRGKGARKVAV